MWWMFVGNHDDNEASHLYLFYAKQLAGPWHPHPANPVVRRAGLARAAGTPVHLDGRLVRPSQESRSTYGACVVFNAIDAMNEAEYSERPISVLRPDTNWSHHDGLHHVATFGPSTYIDAKSLRSPAS